MLRVGNFVPESRNADRAITSAAIVKFEFGRKVAGANGQSSNSDSRPCSPGIGRGIAPFRGCLHSNLILEGGRTTFYIDQIIAIDGAEVMRIQSRFAPKFPEVPKR